MTDATTPAASSKNGLAIAALVLGIVALLGAMIPIFGIFLVWAPALVGIGLGIGAVVKKNAPKLLGWIGLGLSVASVFVAIVSAAIGVGVVSTAVDSAVSEASASAAAAMPKEIVYEVTGDGGSADITYSSMTGGNWGSENANGSPLPFSKTLTPEAGDAWSTFSSFSLMAIGTADTTTLTCTITVDGKVVSTKTSTGAYTSVLCSSSSY
ncbi:MAG TPA: MmpS family transport accessory protein [Microbacteriaceae bacterium]|nr:MmpS family transport accessory protein [Microbacteriaceae bacterium]